MIPGENLLIEALELIASQSLDWYQFVARTANDIGILEAVYAVPVTIYGSFQPVKRSMYDKLGLDLNKEYWNLFAPNNTLDINRDLTGDGFVFKNKTFKCESITPWFGVDGWNEALLVKVPSLQGA